MTMAAEQLKIPAQEVLDRSLLDPEPARIRAELDRLPLNDLDLAIHHSYTLLALLNRALLPLAARQQIMADFSVYCRQFDHRYQQQLGREIKPISDQGYDDLLLFKQEMAIGYKILLIDALKSHPRDYYLASLIFSVIYYNGQMMLQRYDRYLVQPQEAWREINYLFALSEQMHLQHMQVHNDMPGEAPSVAELYRQLLLLNLTNPYHLLPGEHWLLYQYFSHWAAYCRLEAEPPENLKQACFQIDLDGAEGPKRRFGAEARGSLNLRFVQPQKLIMLMQQHLQGLDTGHSATEFGLPEHGHKLRLQELLQDLIHGWQHSDERQPRSECDGYAGIVWGIDTIFQLLDPQLFANILGEGHMLRATGKMVNESENGFCLRLPQQLREGFSNGQVLAMRSDRQSNAQWTLGLVRWQQHLGEKEFLVGIEYIKGKISPTLLTDQDEPQLQTPALLVSKVSEGEREYRLVAPAGCFSLSEELEIELPRQQKRYDIKPRELLRHTALVDFFSFRAETHAA